MLEGLESKNSRSVFMPSALPRCSSLPLASPVLHALAMKCFGLAKDVGKLQKGERCSDAWKRLQVF